MYSLRSDTKYHENYPFMRFFKITVPNEVGYLNVHRSPTPRRGRGSLVVKVSDRGWHVTSSSPVPPKTRRVRKRCTLNISRAQTSPRWCCVVVMRGVPAQVSSSSLDHGSKLRGPLPKALV
ncbi:uncharacterized protein TNCV_4854061 [Trichonephila clavipes]|nr:uncharacterized protein TNCV_4854061 [Trichonephila clavipes]